MNVILDLDETLINTHKRSKFTPRHFKRASLFYHKPMEDKYIVVARPGLDAFLNWLFDKFIVTIWTAASQPYALFVVKHFIINKNHRVPLYIFSSDHCMVSMKHGSSHKDLKILFELFPEQFNSKNTIIIDDREDICENQPNNSYCIKPFLFLSSKSYQDQELFKLKNFLENYK